MLTSQVTGDEAKPVHGDSEYEELLSNLKTHYNPKNPVEEMLVKRIALLDWRLNRTVLAERKSLHIDAGNVYHIPPAGAMERILKYERTMERELRSTITMLNDLRSQIDNDKSGKIKNSKKNQRDDDDSRSEAPVFDDETVLNPGPIGLNSTPTGVEITPNGLDSTLTALFSSSLRVKLLKALLPSPVKSFYIRELASITQSSHGNISRELAHLAQAGIVLRITGGHQVYHCINQSCPIVSGLRSLFGRNNLSAHQVNSPEASRTLL